MKNRKTQGMHPEYVETCFRREQRWSYQPNRFAIITAYATTGQRWSREKNDACDERLRAELESFGVWMQRLTGYSPRTGHAEPGWAVKLDFDAACDLGHRYLQDAIYFVVGDELFVSRCGADRQLVDVGAFSSKL